MFEFDDPYSILYVFKNILEINSSKLIASLENVLVCHKSNYVTNYQILLKIVIPLIKDSTSIQLIPMNSIPK